VGCCWRLQFLYSDSLHSCSPLGAVKAKAQAKPKGEDELDLDGSVDLNESLDESSHELFVEMDNSDSGYPFSSHFSVLGKLLTYFVHDRVSNTIAQTFLESVLEQCLDTHPRVRTAALNTLAHIQRQGLMHPLQVSSQASPSIAHDNQTYPSLPPSVRASSGRAGDRQRARYRGQGPPTSHDD
jgi:hypothetical protein